MRYVFNILICIVLVAAHPVDRENYRSLENKHFTTGEHIKYTARYGFFKAAEGEMIISDEIENMNNRPCFKVDIYGKTTKFFDVIAKVRNHWGAYIDTTSIIPQKFYRYIDEGSYKRNEVVDYNHEQDSLFVHTLSLDDKKLERTDPYAVPDNIQDIVSGVFYLRTINFDLLEKGDAIVVDGFFKNKLFKLQIIYEGKEVIKTKIGKIRAIKIKPNMPDSQVFDGKDSITAWISDDDNKIPLKIKSKMFVGSIVLEINHASGLRNPMVNI